MPKQVLELRLRDFTDLVTLHRLRLAGSNIGQPDIRTMEREFRAVKAAHASDTALKLAINGIDGDKADFDVAWKGLGGNYAHLFEFFGGLATVFPGTSSVESDFSLLKMTSGKHSTNLTDFSLESKLHASQLFDLRTMKLEYL
jgi:hypothetical protein